jgi:hypothetical protein
LKLKIQFVWTGSPPVLLILSVSARPSFRADAFPWRTAGVAGRAGVTLWLIPTDDIINTGLGNPYLFR